MIKNQITYQIGAIFGIIGFISGYRTVRKKVFLVYGKHISKKNIYIFQFSIIIILLFFINMFLDINNLLPYSFVQSFPFLLYGMFLFGISLWVYVGEKIFRDIAQYLSSIPIEQRDNGEYTTILMRIEGFKKVRRILYIPAVLFAYLLYLVFG